MASAFITLPHELIIQILLHLTFRSLLQCGSTCRTLYDVLNSSLALRYHIELGLHGLQDAGSGLSKLELINRLQERQKIWQGLDWRKITVIPMDGQCIAYDLVGGVFVNATEHSLVFIHLPSLSVDNGDVAPDAGSEKQEEGRMITRWDFEDFTIRDVTIDPSQDLAIILEDIDYPPHVGPVRIVHVHLRTMSTNMPHPLAPRPVFQLPVHPLPGSIDADTTFNTRMYDTLVQVVDDVIALFFRRTWPADSHLIPRVVLWNWMEGHMIYDSGDSGLPPYTQHFTLFGRSTFIVACNQSQGSLHLFTFSPSTTNNVPHLLTVFLLPEIQDGHHVHQIMIHCGPTEGRVLTGSLFVPAQDDAVFVITVIYKLRPSPKEVSRTGCAFSIYVHRHTLMRYAATLATVDDSQEIRDIVWDAWGANTYLILNQTPHHWMRYVFGQRIVLRARKNELNVFDLAPVNYGRPQSDSLPDEATSSYMKHATYLAGSVSPCLPIRLSTRKMDILQGFDTWMIDSERIIGVKMDEFDPEILREVHVYSF